jgi:hypothetical protein
MNTLKERFNFAIQHFAVSHLLLLCLFLVIRFFEFLTLGLFRLFPDQATGLLFTGLSMDIWFCSVLAACVFPFYIASYLILGSFTRFFLATLFTIYVLAYISLSQYFAATQVPLDADFWGYTWADIQTTVKTSAFVGWVSILPHLILLGVLFWSYGRAQEIMLAKWQLILFYLVMVCGSCTYALRTPSVDWFSSESAYAVGINKLAFFCQRSAGLFWQNDQTMERPPKVIPLLREADTVDIQ